MTVARKIYMPPAYDINGFYPAVYVLTLSDGTHRTCVSDEDIAKWNELCEGDEYIG